MNPPSKSSLIKKADKLWAKVTKEQAKFRCEWCSKTSALNSHHVISRNNKHLRHDPRNACVLCIGCHFKAHQSALEFTEWFKKIRPEDYKYLLAENKKPPHPISIQDYRNRIEDLTILMQLL
jgi:hypothetical protein